MGIREQLTQLFRSPGSREQERRMTVQEQQQATSPAEEVSQRETRRLDGMSAEDRAWEQAALGRHQAAQDQLKP